MWHTTHTHAEPFCIFIILIDGCMYTYIMILFHIYIYICRVWFSMMVIFRNGTDAWKSNAFCAWKAQDRLVEAAPASGGMSALLERVKAIGEKSLKLHWWCCDVGKRPKERIWLVDWHEGSNWMCSMLKHVSLVAGTEISGVEALGTNSWTLHALPSWWRRPYAAHTAS